MLDAGPMPLLELLREPWQSKLEGLPNSQPNNSLTAIVSKTWVAKEASWTGLSNTLSQTHSCQRLLTHTCKEKDIADTTHRKAKVM